MKATSYSAIRARLAETLREVEAGSAPVVISRRGRPVGVLMSWSQYRETAPAAPTGFADGLLRWRAEAVVANQAADAEDDPFTDVRDRSAGRAPAWSGAEIEAPRKSRSAGEPPRSRPAVRAAKTVVGR